MQNKINLSYWAYAKASSGSVWGQFLRLRKDRPWGDHQLSASTGCTTHKSFGSWRWWIPPCLQIRWNLGTLITDVWSKQMQPTFKSWHRPGLGGVIFFVLVYNSLKARMFSLDNLNHFLVRHHLETKPPRNKKSINLSLCDVLMTQDRQEVSVHLWYLISLFSHYPPPLGQI